MYWYVRVSIFEIQNRFFFFFSNFYPSSLLNNAVWWWKLQIKNVISPRSPLTLPLLSLGLNTALLLESRHKCIPPSACYLYNMRPYARYELVASRLMVFAFTAVDASCFWAGLLSTLRLFFTMLAAPAYSRQQHTLVVLLLLLCTVRV